MNINVDLIEIQLSDYTRENKKIREKKIFLYDLKKNEIEISETIKKIPYYSYYFNVIDKYTFVQVRNMYKTIELNEKYVLCEYLREKESISFDDYFIGNTKTIIHRAFESYSYLLKSLMLLNNNNICFFNLNTDNIVFIHDLPILFHFDNRLFDNRLFDNRLFDNRLFDYKTFELHVLYFMTENNKETISYSDIDYICKTYMDNMDILLFFSQSVKDQYEKDCMTFLKKYINKSKEYIIQDVYKYRLYWDNYSLSMIYLYLFANIITRFSLKNTLINKIALLLLDTIQINERKTLNKTLFHYEKLLEEGV